MLDKIVLKHLDDMNIIEESLNKNIDTLIQAIDIDNVFNAPKKEIMEVAASVKGVIEKKYSLDAMKQGDKFAQEMKTRTIKVADSTDEDLNKDIVV